jgi:hypothetical protein
MKWKDMRKSENVEDVRRVSGPVIAGGVGLGGIIIALLASALLGADPQEILRGMQGAQQAPVPQQAPGVDDRDSEFVKRVLGDTELVFGTVFQKQLGAQYPAPRLVLFSGGTTSGCGSAQTGMGPFYCPADEKVYLDMAFFSAISAAAGENADFARAYAIAHEVGHHIQNVLGIMGKARQQMNVSDQVTSNDISVRLELQADCFAGVWGNSTGQRGLITVQDLEAAMKTAAQIGDDYLQKRSQGYTSPESWTHGSSQQRVRWFRQGLEKGDIRQCDTFAVANP